MRIALDAMGSDNRPKPDVEGAVIAAREYGDTILLVGNEARIQEALKHHNTAGLDLKIIHTDEEIAMTDTPSVVMKTKPNSSMHVGMNLVKNGEADAFVTMGNTGAAHAIATLSTLKRIRGVKRPALTAIFPINGKDVIFLDVGANADAKTEWLEQFAIMGSVYARHVLQVSNPRVATLSNGEEEGKGNHVINEAQKRLRSIDLNYVGHIEPIELLEAKADVLVMDGFVGNIFLKTFEASFVYITNIIREEIEANPVTAVGGLLAKSAFRRARNRIDPGEIAGAPLLGVNGVVLVGHGSSDGVEVKNAINQARRAVLGNSVEEIRTGLERAQGSLVGSNE